MNKNLHDIDRLFKEGIEGVEEKDKDDRVWGILERELDKIDLLNTTRKYKILKRVAAAVLALFALSVSALYWQEQNNGNPKNSNTTNQPNASTVKIENSRKNNIEILNYKTSSSANSSNVDLNDEAQALNTNSAIQNSTNTKKVDDNNYTKQNKKNYTLSKAENSTRAKELKSITTRKEKTSTAVAITITNKDGNFRSLNSSEIVLTENDQKLAAISLSAKKKKKLRGEQLANNESDFLSNNNSYTINNSVSESESLLSLRKNSLRTSGLYESLAINKQTEATLSDKHSSPSKLIKLRRKFKPEFSITPFYSPESITNKAEDGFKEHHEDECETIKSGERIKSSQTMGVQFNMRISPRVSIFSGVNSSKTVSTILPRSIFARPERERNGQPSNGQVKYKINCTAGYSYVTSKTSTSAPTVGDSLQSLSSVNTINYTSIPIGIKYLLASGRISISGITGANFNILSGNTLVANYVELSGTKSQSQVPVQGVKSMYLSAIIGASFDCKIGHGVYFTLSPINTIGLGSINKETPARTKRNSSGLRFGLTYNF